MRKTQNHNNLNKKRFSLFLALLLCFFVSRVEYHPHDKTDQDTEQQQSNEDSNKTFFTVAVDAVVPFVTNLVQITLHLMYDLAGYEPLDFIPKQQQVQLSGHFLEILLERIISINAP